MSDPYNPDDIPDGGDGGDDEEVAEGYQPSGDNSIDTDNEAYVGIEPERQNHAWDTDKPMVSEDEDEAARAAHQKEIEEGNKFTTLNRQGSTPKGVHPTERLNQ